MRPLKNSFWAKVKARKFSRGAVALHARAVISAMLLNPFAQHLIDSRLPAGSGRPKIPEHLGGEANVRVDLRIGLLRPAARARECALGSVHNFAADSNFGTLELLFCPFRRIVRINPAAPGNALSHRHCIPSSKSH